MLRNIYRRQKCICALVCDVCYYRIMTKSDITSSIKASIASHCLLYVSHNRKWHGERTESPQHSRAKYREPGWWVSEKLHIEKKTFLICTSGCNTEKKTSRSFYPYPTHAETYVFAQTQSVSIAKTAPRVKVAALLCLAELKSVTAVSFFSELRVSVNSQWAEAFGSGAKTWGLQEFCCVKHLLDNQWHLKEKSNATANSSGWVRVNQFVPQAIRYNFYVLLYVMFCTNTSEKLRDESV